MPVIASKKIAMARIDLIPAFRRSGGTCKGQKVEKNALVSGQRRPSIERIYRDF
jgi:hypothetical protein